MLECLTSTKTMEAASQEFENKNTNSSQREFIAINLKKNNQHAHPEIIL
jgi:hypothetical protein